MKLMASVSRKFHIPVWFEIFPYLLLTMIYASWASATNNYSRKYCVEHLMSGPVSLAHLPDNFVTLDKDRIVRAIDGVPSQHETDTGGGWSCSQNSIARAMILVAGGPTYRTSSSFLEFAHTVPNSLGAYKDHRFDSRFSFSNRITALLGFFLSKVGMAALTHKVAAYYSVSFGLSTVWLAEYMSFYRRDLHRSDLTFEAYASENFDNVVRKIKESIEMGRAIVPLVIFTMQCWHYFKYCRV